MAEEKKSHARETAVQSMGGLNIANQIQRVSNQTPDADMMGSAPNSNSSGREANAEHEFGTPSSQGQGESYRDKDQNVGPESRSYRLE